MAETDLEKRLRFHRDAAQELAARRASRYGEGGPCTTAEAIHELAATLIIMHQREWGLPTRGTVDGAVLEAVADQLERPTVPPEG
jgi:hypothetical protein